MNVLDENILESQRQLLRSWDISIRQIGLELGRKGMADEEILPFLLTLSRPTFFTRDLRFAGSQICHARYCLIILAVGQYEVAHFVRRLLRHAAFNSQAKRMGAVIRVMPTRLAVWRLHTDQEIRVSWPD
ncbi:MAG: hypothetical protein KGS61_06285 [Verrucomicrobia bacterium]|nr:hypothetical protein [Verrucomicrobiota bacterium]